MEPWQTIMLVGGIVVVSAVVLPRRAVKGSPSNENQTVRNMETALEQFMENMEADNQEIASLVSKSSEDLQAQTMKRDERVKQLELRIGDMEQKLAELSSKAAHVSSEAVMANPPVSLTGMAPSPQTMERSAAALEEAAETAETTEASVPLTPSIRSRYAELFDMYQAGKSIDMIAKKLGRNKGEVQLILQLSKQEEAVRHE
ncbi:hypothetical protein GZH47_03780 [Paenibacillus rhizovicinus]|uniref:Uncharacterized protein n=1 Tax=Paenibacillus rhizovicinus TaxID=2704463 RepID=A0A6C0NV24_9BACL|nr:hypothetical protein [Paenibacillus rhizovicinus]QHW30040.1 hypothetical protein GZH47_03780 [Paenibacillus rhizovicinus]